MEVIIVLKRIVAYIISAIMSLGGLVDEKFNELETTEQYEKLWSAVTTGNEQAMIEAINEGADINKFEYHSPGTVSPVIWADDNSNDKRFVNTMLEYDIDPDFVDTSGTTVFYEAINARDKIFEKLLTLDPDVNYIDDMGENSIDKIILSKNLDIFSDRLEKLINAGADVTADNIKNMEGRINRSEYIESMGNRIACVKAMKVLVDNYKGEDIDKDIYAAYKGEFNENNKCKNNTVLWGIAGYGSKDALEKNLKDDSDLNFSLRLSVAANNFENVKFLIEKGADINEFNDGYYECALNYAVYYNNYDMTKYISDLNPAYIDDGVLIAVKNDNADITKLLLDKGASISNKDAFEEALINNYDDIVKLFVERGFNVNGSSSLGSEPYYVWVFSYCDIDTVKYVHNFSNTLNYDDLCEAVYNSVRQGNLELLEYLKELNADFSKDDANSSNGSRLDSQLMVATGDGYFDVVRFLVENGCTANNYTEEEKEALVNRAKQSDDIYNYLVEKGII